jgi:F-type H+-transporting ATPase subunit b
LNAYFILRMLAEGEVAQTPSLFPNASTVMWTTLNFVILLAVLYKFLFKPLLGAISAREEEINSARSQAAEDKAEAGRLRKEFEAQINNAQRSAQEIVSKATKAATAVKEQIESEARAKGADMLENAVKTIEREKVKALAELREEVAMLAITVAGKVIEKNLNTEEQRRLADRFVEEVGKH